MKTQAQLQARRCCRLVVVLVCIGLTGELGRADSPTLLCWGDAPCVKGVPKLDEPLVADRPDFTEVSSTVGLGVVQLEVGYTYVFDNDGIDQTIDHSYPEPLLRVGLLKEWIEFRVGWNYATELINGIRVSGSEDLLLGFLIGLTPQAGILPEMALTPQMTVPVGPDAFTSGETLPGLNWIYAWDLNDWLSAAGSTQLNRRTDDITTNAYAQWAQSWSVSYKLNDQWGAYTEWFALLPHSADTESPEHFFNGGFTFLISNNIQWDIRAGLGLNDAAEDYFAGTGLSMRFY